jgi:hypothetical protein
MNSKGDDRLSPNTKVYENTGAHGFYESTALPTELRRPGIDSKCAGAMRKEAAPGNATGSRPGYASDSTELAGYVLRYLRDLRF